MPVPVRSDFEIPVLSTRRSRSSYGVAIGTRSAYGATDGVQRRPCRGRRSSDEARGSPIDFDRRHLALSASSTTPTLPSCTTSSCLSSGQRPTQASTSRATASRGLAGGSRGRSTRGSTLPSPQQSVSAAPSPRVAARRAAPRSAPLLVVGPAPRSDKLGTPETHWAAAEMTLRSATR